MEWGRSWLKALAAAKLEEAEGKAAELSPTGYARRVPIPDAGVPEVNSTTESVCIVARVSFNATDGLYNVHQFLTSLLGLRVRRWRAFLFSPSSVNRERMERVLMIYKDERLVLASTPASTDVYGQLDEVASEHCAGGGHDWLLLTHDGVWYAPDALQYLPTAADMVLMNMHSTLMAWDEDVNLRTRGFNQCCMRFNTMSSSCPLSAPYPLMAELSATLLSTARLAQGGLPGMGTSLLALADAVEACGDVPCDGAILQHLVEEQDWQAHTHPLDVCAAYINPNPLSCSMVGGVFYDALNIEEQGCHDIAKLPIPTYVVNWPAFYQSTTACVCRR